MSSSCCDKLFRSFATDELCCVDNGMGCASRVLAEDPDKRRPMIDVLFPLKCNEFDQINNIVLLKI